MATLPNAAIKPIKSKGLFDAAGASGKTYDQWTAAASPTAQMPSIAPAQVNDSVADKVNEIIATDSPIMTKARTDGLKMGNRRGLLNSSITAGAVTDAVLTAAIPIASQDAAQDAARNAAARAFEYSMAGQDDAQAFSSGEAALDRAQQTKMQERDIAYQTAERALDRGLQEKLASWNLSSSDRNAAAQFLTNMEAMYQESYRSIMANTALSADQRSAFLTSANYLRDRQLNLVEQMYDVDLDWGTDTTTGGGTGTTSSTSSSASAASAVGSTSITQDQLNSLYMQYLGRTTAGDPAAPAWLGQPYQVVLNGILSSPEYRSRN